MTTQCRKVVQSGNRTLAAQALAHMASPERAREQHQ